MIFGLGPKAQAVYVGLRGGIASGEFPPGSRLPSHTLLAQKFGVAPLTVRNVLAHLEQQGLVRREQGRGTFVLRQVEIGTEAHRLAAIVAIQQDIMAIGLDVDAVMQCVVERVGNLLGAGLTGVALVSGDYLEFRAIAGPMTGAALDAGFRDRIDTSMLGACIRTGEVAIHPDVRAEAAASPGGDFLGIGSYVGVPLRRHGAIVGALGVASPWPRAFTAGDVDTLRLLTHFIEAAMARAADYEESQEALARLGAANEDRIHQIVETMAEGILLHDPAGHVIFANPVAERILAVVGPAEYPRIWTLHAPDGRELANWERPSVRALWGETVRDAQVIVRQAGGTDIPVSVNATAIYDATRTITGVVTSFRDESARQRAERELRHQSLHDTLTGLPNRAQLQDQLDQALTLARPEGRNVALLLMDLDRFREVNDTFGHYTGDLLLQEVSARVLRVVGETGQVARLGGDEFAVILPDMDGGGARAVARRIDQALHEPFAVAGMPLAVEASLGIALFPQHSEDVIGLLRRADVAMYTAKRSSFSHAEYTVEADLHTPDRLRVATDLRYAIEREELSLTFQPKVALPTDRVRAVEALLRWQHPDLGPLSPGDFIPLAENTGLIRPLSAWVINAALRQCRSWRDSGLSTPVAVNLSVRNLQDPDLAGRVATTLQDYDLPPDALQIEITESAIMTDSVRALETLTALHQMGIHISIDDFGTGYTSLAYLTRLPVSEVKIDRSFVTAMMDGDGHAGAIVHSVIALGHNLGMEVVAEGIEDQATLNTLRALGCDLAQGY